MRRYIVAFLLFVLPILCYICRMFRGAAASFVRCPKNDSV